MDASSRRGRKAARLPSSRRVPEAPCGESARGPHPRASRFPLNAYLKQSVQASSSLEKMARRSWHKDNGLEVDMKVRVGLAVRVRAVQCSLFTTRQGSRAWRQRVLRCGGGSRNRGSASRRLPNPPGAIPTDMAPLLLYALRLPPLHSAIRNPQSAIRRAAPDADEYPPGTTGWSRARRFPRLRPGRSTRSQGRCARRLGFAARLG